MKLTLPTFAGDLLRERTRRRSRRRGLAPSRCCGFALLCGLSIAPSAALAFSASLVAALAGVTYATGRLAPTDVSARENLPAPTTGPSITPPPASAAPATVATHASPGQTHTPATGLMGNPATDAHPLEKTDLLSWLDGLLPYALEDGDIAGGVVVVVKDGAVLLAKGYGYADVAARTPVDPERTLFRPGSVSKLLTWTAVMQLVESGRLDLDRDVNAYLDFHIPERPDGPITLRDIMTHTAGFEEQIKSLITADVKELVPLAQYAANFTPTRIFKAGSTPAYSNYATALAGYIVQRVAGQSFDDYIEAHLFRPLDMTHSSFRQPLPAALSSDMAKGYPLASGPAKPYEIVTPAPAGSLAATGMDMAHFMIAHLQDGEYQGQRILQAATAQMMHTTALTMIPPLNRMLLGFYEQNYEGHRVISHGGDTEWMHSYLHLFPDDHVGLFMAFNSVGREGAVGRLRAALFDEFVDRYFTGPWPAGTVAPDVAARHTRLMVGYYDDSRRPDRSFMSLLSLIAPVKVAATEDGTLTMSLIKGRNGTPRHYREIAPFVWRDTVSGWRLAARAEEGRVVRMSVDELSPFMVFDPTPGWRSPALLLPAMAFALGSCLLTAVLWPIAAISRRRHHVTLPITGLARNAHRAARIAAAALVVMSAAWLAVVLGGLANLGVLSSALDPLILLLYALSVIVYIGAPLVMIWAVRIAWVARRPWAACAWTLILAVAAVIFLYCAVIFHLMSFVTRY